MRISRIYHVLWAALITCIVGTSQGQDAVDRDYSQELTRIAPTEPDQALETFVVAPGYKLELVAAEPLVTSPVAAAFDEDGRLYVVEMRDYSEQDQDRLGRIRCLEDTNGDGRFDKSTIFAENLSWPTAIICYDGGVFVGAAPEILYLKDTTGDGIAEERRVVFTGFGRGNVQGLLNSFQWGLDCRIHVAVSSAGAQLQATTALGVPQGKPLILRGRDFAFDPRDPTKFIATSGGGQHGMSFDDWGRKFVCSNSDHIQLIMLEDADLARNPYLAPPNPRISIAVDGPQADVFRVSPVEPWREIRTRLRKQGIVPGVVEGGGRAAGYFTGASGITIYRGNAWPKEDRGLAIVGDVGGNLIHRKRLVPNGLELSAERIDENSEFVASRDPWFRPVQYLNAPDGALYVLDMYREVIEHPASIPPVIKKHLDLTSGRDRGRIYRIIPKEYKHPVTTAKLSTATTADLVAMLADENGWHRDTAARLLYQRQDVASLEPLFKLATESDSSLGRMHAMYMLRAFQQYVTLLRPEILETSDPRVRVHALRIARRISPISRAGMETLLAACTDRDQQIRLEGALALGDFQDQRRVSMARSLAISDADNRWIRAAVGSSFAKEGGALWLAMVEDPDLGSKPERLPWIDQLARQASRQMQGEDLKQFAKLLDDLAGRDRPAFKAALISLAGGRNYNLLKTLPDEFKQERTRGALHELLGEAQRDVVNAEVPLTQRLSLVPLLTMLGSAGEGPLLRLLGFEQPPELQSLALEGWGALQRSDAREVLRAWPKLSPALREQALNLLVGRDDWASQLLTAIQAQEIDPNQLTLPQWEALGRRAPAIRIAAKRLQPTPNRDRTALIDQYLPALAGEHDAAAGGELFKKHCASCHKLGGVGFELGPNLAAMKNRGAEAIVTNVLDPNREVNPQYLTYAVVTKDGRVLSGMIGAETATSLTLKRAENQEDTVLRIDIEEFTSTGLSLMPQGLEKQLTPQQLADVVSFILKQE